MGATFDVTIAGCGIVGAACADEFARRGMRVMVVDRDLIASGATAAWDNIVVMDDSDAQLALTRYSQQLWLELKNDLPPDVEYEQRFWGDRGTLRPAHPVASRLRSGAEPRIEAITKQRISG